VYRSLLSILGIKSMSCLGGCCKEDLSDHLTVRDRRPTLCVEMFVAKFNTSSLLITCSCISWVIFPIHGSYELCVCVLICDLSRCVDIGPMGNEIVFRSSHTYALFSCSLQSYVKVMFPIP
jgi:hypothetical protein